MKLATLRALRDARAERVARVLVTELATGRQRLLDPYATAATDDDPLLIAARRAAEADRSQLLETAEGPAMLQVFNPALRMLIVGAVHIAQSLVVFARMNGFDVTVIDPRRAFATRERFPEVRLLHAWPERALRELELDRRCALVTLSHDPKLDDPALAAGLQQDVLYVGALGSRRTHQARLERLRARGLRPDQLTRIAGPVGLDIGAVGAAEIATSIMAQVVQTLRKATP
jgi:xanthine dehydrogenase accessory factor